MQFLPRMTAILKGGSEHMELFDILKAKAFLPVNDAEAVLFARATPRPVEHYGIRIDKSEPEIET